MQSLKHLNLLKTAFVRFNTGRTPLDSLLDGMADNRKVTVEMFETFSKQSLELHDSLRRQTLNHQSQILTIAKEMERQEKIANKTSVFWLIAIIAYTALHVTITLNKDSKKEVKEN